MKGWQFFLIQSLWMLAAKAQVPFTVDLMMRNEEFGQASFDPAGSKLVFERYRPYAEMAEYDDLAATERRARLYVVDAASEAAPRSLFSEDSCDGYTLGAFSPSGQRMIYVRSRSRTSVVGAYDFSMGQGREFPANLEPNNVFSGPLWISETEVVFSALYGEGATQDRREQRAAAWRAAREGRNSTASVVGSGNAAVAPMERQYALVRANAITGTVRVVAEGHFRSWVLSPDATHLAALKEIPYQRDASEALENATASSGLLRRSIVIFDLLHDTSRSDVCHDCDVVPTSLGWSPSGARLGFFARSDRETWDSARFWIYRPRLKHTNPVELGNLSPTVERGVVFFNPRAAWLGESLVIRASIPNKRSPSWFLIAEGQKPQDLTPAFDAPADVIGTTDRSVLVLSAGELWGIESTSQRQLITNRVTSPVHVEWPQPNQFGFVFSPSIREPMVLRASDQAWSFDARTAALRPIPASSGNTTALTASRSSARFALVAPNGNASTLVIAEHDRSPRNLVTINEHLLGVVGGRPMRLDYDGPQGKRLISWILLPPQFQTGRPVPTVAHIYPGIGNFESWGQGELQDFFVLNPHLLAARGYAVLIPSLLLSEEIPRDPLNGLADMVLAAVDAAVKAGYSDPERLAIQGHSAGGYTTYGVITQTQRFKAAIALAGPVNLISFYGQFLGPMTDAPSLYIPSFVETGQFGLGAPPWEEPQRYLRNSPVMHAASISTPLMIVQGDLDYVSLVQGEEMFTALLRQGRDALFVRYWGEGHTLASPANIRDMWNRMFAWYDQHLGSGHR